MAYFSVAVPDERTLGQADCHALFSDRICRAVPSLSLSPSATRMGLTHWHAVSTVDNSTVFPLPVVVQLALSSASRQTSNFVLCIASSFHGFDLLFNHRRIVSNNTVSIDGCVCGVGIGCALSLFDLSVSEDCGNCGKCGNEISADSAEASE